MADSLIVAKLQAFPWGRVCDSINFGVNRISWAGTTALKIPVSSKIFLGVVAVQIVTAAVILGWFSYSVRSEIKQLIAENAQEAVLRSIRATEDHFSPANTTIQAAQRLISRGVLDRNRPEQLVRYLHDQLRLWPQFAGAYVGYPDGGFYYVMRDGEETNQGTRTKIIDVRDGQREVTLTWRDANYNIIKVTRDPGDNYDPRTRPWFRAALKTNEVVWTDPYVFFTSHKPGITAAIAIDNNEKGPSAVIGIDIEIDQISNYLRQISLGPQRSAFIVGPHDEVISHSTLDTVTLGKTAESKPRFLKLSELKDVDQSIRDQIQARISNQSNADMPTVWQAQTGEGDYVVAMGRVSSVNWPWQIVTIQPAEEVGGSASGIDVSLIVIVLLAIGVAAVGGYLLARSVGLPLAQLWTNAKLARGGNIELMYKISSGHDEIDGTAAILMEMGEIQRSKGAVRKGPSEAKGGTAGGSKGSTG